MKNTKKYLSILIAFICIVNTILLFSNKAFAYKNIKHILILNSEDENSPYSQELTKTIQSSIKDTDYIIHVENMDASFYKNNKDLDTELYSLYKNKFKNYKFDAIIGEDEISLYFLDKYHDKLFKNVPVVFCEINKSSISKVLNNKSFYAVGEVISIKETIDLSLKLHKNYKTIFIPINLEFVSDHYKKIYEHLKIEYKKKNIDVIIHYGSSMDKLTTRLKTLPENTIILLNSNFRNKYNDVISLEYMCKIISENASYPIYGLWNELLDFGIIGGKIAVGNLQGKYAAKLVLDILEKKTISNRLVTVPNNYMFNYNMLKKYNIPFSQLPRGSIIINKPSPFYSVNKNILYLTLLLFILILIYLILNISKRIKLQKSLKENLEYDKLKTEFFSNLSHELKTPLNLIFGTTQLIELHIKNNTNYPNIDKNIKILKQNCYRMIRLINNLIDITKLDCGYFNTPLENLNIVSIIEDITLSVADYTKTRNVSILFDTDIEEKLIAVDPNSIERIMLNLLSNAMKFTNSGDKINVNIYDKKDFILINVSDTGLGIPKDKLEIIFDRFRQVDKSLTRNQEGSGIGLSLVKALVHMYNGEIKVYSEYSKGTTFSIKLPVKLLDTNSNTQNLNSHKTLSSRIEKIEIEFSDIYSLH